jgi:hypothetical protein
MTFRRRRDEWDGFLTRHGPAVRECGVPDEVVADKWRFLRFLDDGRDEGVDAGFDGRGLTDDLVGRVEPYYRDLVASRWRGA